MAPQVRTRIGFDSRHPSVHRDSFERLGGGGFLTGLALTQVLPHQYAAPFEWVGVFCIMVGLTYLYSLRWTLPLAVTAFLLGVVADPLVFGQGSLQTWLYANVLVLFFALAGTLTCSLVLMFTTIRES